MTETVRRARVQSSVAFDARIEPQYVNEIAAPTLDETSASSVVTRVGLKVGQSVQAGDLAVEISGRPVFVLRGSLPAFRTLSPGMSGPDVRQLQMALGEAGYQTSDSPGYYGASTSAEVAELYRSRGYSATRVGDEEALAAEEMVLSAQRSLTQAQQNRASQLDLTFATEDLARAQGDLATAQAKSGAQVTLGELVFVPSLPARATSVSAAVGSDASGALMTLSSGPLVVRGTPFAADAISIRKGAKAQLLMGPGGSGRGVVAGILPASSNQATDAADSPAGSVGLTSELTYTIAPKKRLPSKAAGIPVRVIVAVDTSPRAGLVVPISAITSSADGETTLTVVHEGQQSTVPISPGFAGDGFVQVVSTQQNALREGDRVVTGLSAGTTTP